MSRPSADATRRKIVDDLLPKLESRLRAKYASFVPAKAVSLVCTGHLQLWRNALLDRDETAQALRSAMMRLGYGITGETLTIVDDYIATELMKLTDGVDALEKSNLQSVIASTLGALSLGSFTV